MRADRAGNDGGQGEAVAVSEGCCPVKTSSGAPTRATRPASSTTTRRRAAPPPRGRGRRRSPGSCTSRAMLLDQRQDLELALAVERGQRLVQQQQPRRGEQRAADGHALPLAARQLGRRGGRADAPMPSVAMIGAGVGDRRRGRARTSARTAGSVGRSYAGTAARPGTRARCGACAAGTAMPEPVSSSTSSPSAMRPWSGRDAARRSTAMVVDLARARAAEQRGHAAAGCRNATSSLKRRGRAWSRQPTASC